LEPSGLPYFPKQEKAEAHLHVLPPDLLQWQNEVLLLLQQAEADVRLQHPHFLKSHLAELPMLFHP
jgi:hypothetical protein